MIRFLGGRCDSKNIRASQKTHSLRFFSGLRVWAQSEHIQFFGECKTAEERMSVAIDEKEISSIGKNERMPVCYIVSALRRMNWT